MRIIRDKISLDELKKMSANNSHKLVKIVVDVENNIMAIDVEFHADGHALLLQEGSSQENVWGVNVYPYKLREEWIEYYSTINLRPLSGNASRWVEDSQMQEKIKKIVNALIFC